MNLNEEIELLATLSTQISESPVSFNDVPIPEFVKVTGRSFPVLSNLEVNYKESPKQIGGSFSHVKQKSKSISLDVKILPSPNQTLDDQMDTLSNWLIGDNFKPSRLTFSEQSDRYVLANVIGNTDIEDLFKLGEGTITFVAVNPLKYMRETQREVGNSPLRISYKGSVDQPFICEFTLSAATSSIEIAVDKFPDRKIRLVGSFQNGNKLMIDSNQKKILVNEQVNMKVLTIDSDWLMVTSGENVIQITTNDKTFSGNINYSGKIAFN